MYGTPRPEAVSRATPIALKIQAQSITAETQGSRDLTGVTPSHKVIEVNKTADALDKLAFNLGVACVRKRNGNVSQHCLTEAIKLGGSGSFVPLR